MKKQFFAKEGEKGLTARKAQTLSLWAQKLLKPAWNSIRNTSFVTEKIVDMNNSNGVITKCGTDEVSKQEEIDLIAKVNSFTSWINEAIKEKDALSTRLDNISIYEWAELKGITLPVRPSKPAEPTPRSMKGLKESLMYEIWDRNQIYKYFHLKNVCATVHDVVGADAPYEEALDELLKVLANPCQEVWKGDKLYVRQYSSCVDPEVVQAEYERLQQVHNAAQSELNAMEMQLEQEVKARYHVKLQEYADASLIFEEEMKRQHAAFKQWYQEESEKVRQLKIIIPEPLVALFKEVRNLGKEQIDME